MKPIFPAGAVLALLSGCYPYPHDYVLTQEFSGVLFDGTTPMAGVSVLVAHTGGETGDFCAGAKAVTVTNDAGAFRIPAEAHKRLFVSVLVPPQLIIQATSICFDNHGKHKLGTVLTSPSNRSVRYEAVCDWRSAGVAFGQGFIQEPAEQGICQHQ